MCLADVERAERTLQAETGSTDLLLGAYYSELPGKIDSSWFAQALLQAPLSTREDYRPGQRFTVDIGYRYDITVPDRLDPSNELLVSRKR